MVNTPRGKVSILNQTASPAWSSCGVDNRYQAFCPLLESQFREDCQKIIAQNRDKISVFHFYNSGLFRVLVQLVLWADPALCSFPKYRLKQQQNLRWRFINGLEHIFTYLPPYIIKNSLFRTRTVKKLSWYWHWYWIPWAWCISAVLSLSHFIT